MGILILPAILTVITMVLLYVFVPGIFANKSSDDSNKENKS